MHLPIPWLKLGEAWQPLDNEEGLIANVLLEIRLLRVNGGLCLKLPVLAAMVLLQHHDAVL